MEQDTNAVEVLDSDARRWASLCHASALLGLISGVGFFLGPLILWLIKKEDHPFIDEQGKEALNFQITMLIAMLISGLLVLVVIGFVLLFVVGLTMIILPIIAAIKASEGTHYRYPLSIRFVK